MKVVEYNIHETFDKKETIMKKYLFGLGAMLVGAGLMFVLMHGEVSADSRPKPFTCSIALDSPEVSYRPAGNVRY